MRKTIKIDVDKLGSNPLLRGFKFEVVKVIDGQTYAPDVDGTLKPTTYYMERQQSCKVFYDIEIKKKIFLLSSAAQRMFLYILYNMETGKDYVFINKDRFMQMNNVGSHNTVKKAIDELGRVGFITPTAAYPNDVYWIDPTILFSGSRIRAFPKNKVIVK